MAKKKGTPYTVRVVWSWLPGTGAPGTHTREVKVWVPDDFDRVRGSHDTARDLAAAALFDPGASWRRGPNRHDGTIANREGCVATMTVECDRRSPSGCPIEAGEEVYDRVRYRVVRVGSRKFNEGRPRTDSDTIAEALRMIAGLAVRDNHDHWRVLEIPAGEPWDYDGIVVADLRIGRGVA